MLYILTRYSASSHSNLRLVQEVAGSLQWAPSLKLLANKIIKGILEEGGGELFDGVHLRMEKDARDWMLILGGREVRRSSGSIAIVDLLPFNNIQKNSFYLLLFDILCMFCYFLLMSPLVVLCSRLLQTLMHHEILFQL